MRLSILIATIPERKPSFIQLLIEFKRQTDLLPTVEVSWNPAPKKEMSIGEKRNRLLKAANGDYIVFFDDDDWPSPNYVQLILKAIETNPDCIGINIDMTTNGQKPQSCIHSKENKTWFDKKGVYYRNVTHFNPVKRELAQAVGFKDLRFGEDKDYADRLTSLCNTEVFIEEPLFNYRYSNLEKHNSKYGIE